VEVVASLSQGRTAAAQYGLFTYKSVPVIFEPPCINGCSWAYDVQCKGTFQTEIRTFVFVFIKPGNVGYFEVT